jgi:hypothetical protein
MEYRVESLEGALLNAAVAKADGKRFAVESYATNPPRPAACWLRDEDGRPLFTHGLYAPSLKWEQGGPIIERERIVTVPTTGYRDDGPTFWAAACLGPEGAFSHYIDEPLPFSTYRNDPAAAVGATPLIAAMRAFVASRLGETVDLP